MFVFPAFISPLEMGIVLPFIGIPIIIVAFVVWHVRKLNRIEKILKDIQGKLE
ncbi:MAG: hypothetical protein P4L49_07405 [Desulfosporosinus sp.]|nr:hypothetical protein [Desulfosporosinus sp.]